MKVFSYPNMLLSVQSSSLLSRASQGNILELAQFQEARRSTQYFPSCNLKAEATVGTSGPNRPARTLGLPVGLPGSPLYLE
jgi:hypothetical protein